MDNKIDGVGTQAHYEKQGIQPIDYIVKNGMNFLEGNVIKYVTRYKDKNGLEDLLKAKQHLTWLIDEVERDINARETFVGMDLAKKDSDETVVHNIASGALIKCHDNEPLNDCITRLYAEEIKNATGLNAGTKQKQPTINPHHQRRYTDKEI